MNRLYILVLILCHMLTYGGGFFDNHCESPDGELVSDISKKNITKNQVKSEKNDLDIANILKYLPVTDECSNTNENNANNLNYIDDAKNLKKKRINYKRLLEQQNKHKIQLINFIKQKKHSLKKLENIIFTKQNREVVIHAISHFLCKNNQNGFNKTAMENVKKILALINNKKKFKLVKNSFLEIAKLNTYNDVLLNIFKYDVKNIITFLYMQGKHNFFESIQLLINKYYTDEVILHKDSEFDKDHYKYLLHILNNVAGIDTIDMDFLYGVNSKDGKSLEENDLTSTVSNELLTERINLYKTFNIYHLISILIKIADNTSENEFRDIKLRYNICIKSLLLSDTLHEFYAKYFVFLQKMLNEQSKENKNGETIKCLAEDARKNISILQKYLNENEIIAKNIKRKKYSYKKDKHIEEHINEKELFITKLANTCNKEYLKSYIVNKNIDFYKLIQLKK